MSDLQLLPADLATALEGKPDWLLKSALAAWESRQARAAAKKTPSESPLAAPREEPLHQQSGPITPRPRKANLVADLIASVQATLRNPNKQTAQSERASQPPNSPLPPPAQGRAVDLSRFEWRDLIEKADRTLEQHGDPKALGPARKLLVYLLALAIKHGARQHPTREAHVFKPVWELAADMIALGWFRTQKVDHAARTIRGWLANPRYQHELRAWLAWEEWMTTDPELQQYLAKEKGGKPPVALVGGMLWRVRVGRPHPP